VPPPVEEAVLPQELEQLRSSLSDLRYQVERHHRMLGQAQQDYDHAANEIRELQERLAWVEAPLSATQRLERLEQGSARLEQGLARLGGQFDLLIQLQQHGVAPPPQAPAPGNPLGPGPGTA
jgi:chromosome segregation ATPase